MMDLKTGLMIAGFILTVVTNAVVVGVFAGVVRANIKQLVATVKEHDGNIDTLKLDMVAQMKDSKSAFRQIDDLKKQASS